MIEFAGSGMRVEIDQSEFINMNNGGPLAPPVSLLPQDPLGPNTPLSGMELLPIDNSCLKQRKVKTL